MSADEVVRRSTLGRLIPLGEGGTAQVFVAPQFSLPGLPNIVYKQYKPEILAHAGPSLFPGLQSLVRRRHGLKPEQLALWDQRIVWPLRVVVPDNEPTTAVGVLMVRIPANYFQQFVHPVTRTAGLVVREIDSLFGLPADMTRLGFPAVSVPQRLQLVARIAGAYSLMHGADVIVGDISGRNLVYDPAGAPSPTVMIVDTDSARVKGSRSAFANQPHTPTWFPPEAMAAIARLEQAKRAGNLTPQKFNDVQNDAMTQSFATDVFKFGLMVVRILDYGRQRSGNRDPARAVRLLRSHGCGPWADLLVGSLATTDTARPSMREWYFATKAGASAPVQAPVPTPAPAQRGSAPASVATEPADGTVSAGFVYRRGKGWQRLHP